MGEKPNPTSLALEFGFMIALPLLVFSYTGKWIDAKLGTEYYLYIGVGVALLCSGVWFYRLIKPFMPPK
ncbi:MAG TPA: AtpZ/AtpI family protein [Patescibacteria group bacterium]|nr:AtpZ/AtpI family protein [Patescibacteria group bacterium]